MLSNLLEVVNTFLISNANYDFILLLIRRNEYVS